MTFLSISPKGTPRPSAIYSAKTERVPAVGQACMARPCPAPSCLCFALFSTQTLCRGGWNASFEELQDVDHFEIIWKLTQKDYVLTQVGHLPSL